MLGEPGLGGELAAKHLLALGVHDAGVRGRFRQKGKETFQVETQALGEYEPFRQCQPVQTQDEIDRQPGLAAHSGGADEKELPGQGAEVTRHDGQRAHSQGDLLLGPLVVAGHIDVEFHGADAH